jgi:hypothetical protein
MAKAIVWRNANNGRWYAAGIIRDLFGQVGVETMWGGARRAGCRVRFTPTASDMDAEKVIAKIDARRRQHGYQRCLR